MSKYLSCSVQPEINQERERGRECRVLTGCRRACRWVRVTYSPSHTQPAYRTVHTVLWWYFEGNECVSAHKCGVPPAHPTLSSGAILVVM